MGIPRRPDKVKLIIGLLFSDIDVYNKAKKDLAKRFGRIDFESNLVDFTHTSYYEGEMGPGLKRKFLSFSRLADPGNIHAAKVKTNALEKRYSKGGRRTINIDPGYLNLSKVVLFSTKDYTHRIYLGKGIFSEVTLFYKSDTFNPWPWTYPDYKTSEYMDIFGSIRGIYKDRISKPSKRCIC
ncbi:MAG: DUF4416 family protein [Candidatus Omnitrophica bacterium]|nr:DUF4416 family protein [Candidatus Omnitrophota bacterium]